MKLKKKTSIMMVATAAVAAVGIAAVSFAAWTGSYQDSISASASTGNVNLFGFGANASVTWENGNKLVPYDQKEATVSEGEYIISAEIPAYNVYAEDYTITVSATTETEVSYKLYAQISKETVSAPTANTEESALGNSGWKEITAANGAVLVASENNETAGSVSGQKLYVILVADGVRTEATYTINITLTSESNPTV